MSHWGLPTVGSVSSFICLVFSGCPCRTFSPAALPLQIDYYKHASLSQVHAPIWRIFASPPYLCHGSGSSPLPRVYSLASCWAIGTGGLDNACHMRMTAPCDLFTIILCHASLFGLRLWVSGVGVQFPQFLHQSVALSLGSLVGGQLCSGCSPCPSWSSPD